MSQNKQSGRERKRERERERETETETDSSLSLPFYSPHALSGFEDADPY